MPPFVPGLQLARVVYWFDVIAPVLDNVLPAPRRAAALLAEGSDVLGFDTEQSTDHGFGPKVFVFAEHLQPEQRIELDRRVDEAIPTTFRGYRTRFPRADGAPTRHQVLFTTVVEEFDHRLNCDPRTPLAPVEWLRMPTQHLRALTAGEVFEDGPGHLTEVRRRLAWYPDEVWRYVLACQWRRVAQEEAFVGRCGQVGDELGSAVVAARLVRELMRLCFLIEREYAPYSKWLGSAFARLDCARDVLEPMRAVLESSDWRNREGRLTTVVETVARRFNELGLARTLDPSVRRYYDRPFLVLGANRFADACIETTPLRTLGWIGAVDQFVDSTDVLSYPDAVRAVSDGAYESET